MNTWTQRSRRSLEASVWVFPEEANTTEKALATADLVRDCDLPVIRQFLRLIHTSADLSRPIAEKLLTLQRGAHQTHSRLSD